MQVSRFRTVLKEEKGVYNADGRKVYNDPRLIVQFALDELELGEAAEEYVYVLCLDIRLHLKGVFEVSHGSSSSTFFPVKEIFQKALLIGCENIVIIHNHPSGDTSPSKDDINSTKRIVEAGKIIGVSVVDHVIVGSGSEYYSFAANKCY